MAENIDLQNFDWEAYENGDVTKVGQTKEELTAKYDNTLNAVKQGEVVKGIVKAINKREVIVSVGFKSDGIVPAAEFRYNPDLKVGDEVEVYVVTPEDKNGQLELSHKQARAAQSWDRVNEALANEEIVKGFIKCRTKGGMIVRGFPPRQPDRRQAYSRLRRFRRQNYGVQDRQDQPRVPQRRCFSQSAYRG